MKVLQKTVRKYDIYKAYIKLINGMLNLTPKEVDIMALLVKFDYEWEPKTNGDFKDVISTDNRRAIMRDIRINKNNLTNYIVKFKEKGLLIKNENGGWEIPKEIVPVIDDNKLDMTFIIYIDHEE